MSHTIRDKEKLIARIRRLKGQMDGVERALEAEKPCIEILRQLASVRGAMNGLTLQVMEDHLHEHVVDVADDATRHQGGDELVEIMRTYLK